MGAAEPGNRKSDSPLLDEHDEHRANARKEMTLNVLAWAGNVLTSVLIVFCNKLLMGAKGYGFSFATTLSALHFLVSGATVKLTQGGGKGSEQGGKRLPLKDLIMFTFVADASIVTLNLSLLLNPVSTYQIAKLLIIPFVCLVEAFAFGRHFTTSQLATIAMVVAGVSIVTVQEISFDGTLLGLLLAGGSVVSSGMQQILVRTMQQAHGLTSNELLGCVAPVQAGSLLLMGPVIDKLVTAQWVFQYTWTLPALLALAASCTLAVGVNISQFMCLGRFSAVSFQVLGHAKTVLVLLGSWVFLGESASHKKLLGMVLAVVGMVLYGQASMAKPATSPKVGAGAGGKAEKERLLGGEDKQSAISIVAMAEVEAGARPAAGSGQLLK